MDTCEKTVNIATESFHKTLCVDVREYNPSRFKDDVSKASRDNCVRKVWVSWSCSEAFAEEIPQEKLILDHTPPMALKAAKNGAELEGIMNITGLGISNNVFCWAREKDEKWRYFDHKRSGSGDQAT